MDTLSFKTQQPKKQEIQKQWLIVDATDQTLGRFASRVAYLLRGKHKPYFAPHLDCGDHVIVINAEKIRLSGKKIFEKTYIHHTGYPGGQREIPIKQMFARYPERIIELAVKRMLPKNRLGRRIFTHLHVYRNDQHKHQAQNPIAFDLQTLNK